MIEQIEYVPVKKMVEVVRMVPKTEVNGKYEVQRINAKELTPGCKVYRYTPGQKEVEANEEAGVVDKYDPLDGLAYVAMPDGSKVPLKPENLIIEKMPVVARSVSPCIFDRRPVMTSMVMPTTSMAAPVPTTSMAAPVPTTSIMAAPVPTTSMAAPVVSSGYIAPTRSLPTVSLGPATPYGAPMSARGPTPTPSVARPFANDPFQKPSKESK